MVRRSSTETFQRLQGIRDDITLHTGDLLDQRSLVDVLRECEPPEIYNLAAMSFVAASWSQPVLTAEFTATGVTRMLEAMREAVPGARFYQASSSEMFGKVLEVPQRESTPFYPRSPYGVAKAYGHFITVNYRESYDLFACSGILFNHECLHSQLPLMVREDGVQAVRTPADLVPLRAQGAERPELRALRAARGLGRRGLDRGARDHRHAPPRPRSGPPPALDPEPRRHRRGDRASPHARRRPRRGASRCAGGGRPPCAVPRRCPHPPLWTVLSDEMAEFLGPHGGRRLGRSRRRRAAPASPTTTPRSAARVAQLWSRCFLGTAPTGSAARALTRTRASAS